MYLFHDPEAGLPVHVQLKEQVEVALGPGPLRPGDLLPSLRRVADGLGAARMLVRNSSQPLQTAGSVAIIHGRGAVATELPRATGRLTIWGSSCEHRIDAVEHTDETT